MARYKTWRRAETSAGLTSPNFRVLRLDYAGHSTMGATEMFRRLSGCHESTDDPSLRPGVDCKHSNRMERMVSLSAIISSAHQVEEAETI